MTAKIELWNIKLDAFKRDGIGRTIFKRGVHEPHIGRWLKSCNKVCKGNFIDVGANIGYYTLIFSVLAGNAGFVIAIEPEQANLNLLRHNLIMNNCKNVTVIPTALGDKNTTVHLSLYKASNRGRHAISADYGYGYQEAPSQTLDTILNKEIFQEKEFDLLKMDIEGYEFFAFQGAEKSLKRIKCIVLEYSPDLISKTNASISAKDFLALVSVTHPYVYEFSSHFIYKTNVEDVLKNFQQRDLIFIREDMKEEEYCC